MKGLTMKQFYPHPKARADLGKRETPIFIHSLARAIRLLLRPRHARTWEWRGIRERTEKIEAIGARTQFERGGSI